MYIIEPVIWCFSVIVTAGFIAALLSAGHDVYRRDEDERC